MVPESPMALEADLRLPLPDARIAWRMQGLGCLPVDRATLARAGRHPWSTIEGQRPIARFPRVGDLVHSIRR